MHKRLTCNLEELADLYHHWKNGGYGILDFGQLVHKKYIKEDTNWPSLMNETNEFKAYSLAREECVEDL